MPAFLIHLVTYLAVCGFLTVVWALTSGSFADLSLILRNLRTDPGVVRALGFWPVWIWTAWGMAIVIHLGVVLAGTLSGRRRRARRRRRAAAIAAPARHGGADAGATGGPERRWVAVMFTDLAESTRLNEALGDEAWSRLLQDHRALVRRALSARAGTEVGTQGDGFLARFPTPAEAVLCAVDIQRELSELREPAALRIRIGINAGEAVEDDGDLVGRVVNLAARVAAEARPGEILVTEPVADYLGGRLDFEDRGVRTLKGVPQPRHLLAVRWAGAPGGGDAAAAQAERS